MVLRKLKVIAWVALFSFPALANPTPGYQEQVLQWTVQANETCADIADAIYGDDSQTHLLKRYNDVNCSAGILTAGITLVVPAKATKLPAANLRSTVPAVKARPPGGAWAAAKDGMPLHPLYSVNTLAAARANIQFRDRTNIHLGEHTLVVIYGTADETKVTKQEPPSVELQEGELFAGLAALRGKPVEVALKDGGSVRAKSKDAVLRKKGKRTTVSVFDGSAVVRSGGKKLNVPKNYGSVLVAKKAPTPPRKLPAAPTWESATTQGMVGASSGGSVIHAAWSPVPSAVGYRVELAKDKEFLNVVLREEVPATVRSFRAESLPAGDYHLRARALDSEQFLGLATPTRSVVVLAIDTAEGSVEPGRIEVNPYGRLLFGEVEGVELALDDGGFEPMPGELDLRLLAPQQLRFRKEGAEPFLVQVSYTSVAAKLRLTRQTPDAYQLLVAFEGLLGVDIPARVMPVVEITHAGKQSRVALTRVGDGSSTFSASIPVGEPGAADLRVVDRSGRVLGSARAAFEVKGAASPTALREGIHTAPIVPSPTLGVAWWRPDMGSYALGGLAMVVPDEGTTAQASVLAAAAIGDFDVTFRTGTHKLGKALSTDTSFWVGGGYGWLRSAGAGLSASTALKLALPRAEDSPGTRLEPSFAAAYDTKPWSLSGNLGARVRIGTDRAVNAVPDAQGYLLLGSSYRFNNWVAAFTLLDAHLFSLEAEDSVRGRAGLALGLEAGDNIFGGLSLRASPWKDDAGHWLGQLSFGIRQSHE